MGGAPGCSKYPTRHRTVPATKNYPVQISRVPCLRKSALEQGVKRIIVLFEVIKIRYKPLVMKHATKTHLQKLLLAHQEKCVPANYTGTELPLYSPEVRNHEQADMLPWKKKIEIMRF